MGTVFGPKSPLCRFLHTSTDLNSIDYTYRLIMFENEEDVKASITYFNGLPDEDKALIVSDLDPQTFKMKHHLDSLFPLLFNVQVLLSKYDGIKIGTELVELGLEETYARLIVLNMKKHAPTIQYQISQLQSINDDIFLRLQEIVNAAYIDRNEQAIIIEKYNITNEQFNSIVSILTHTMTGLLRGEMTEKEIFRMFTVNGLSSTRSEQLLNIIQLHKDDYHATLTFSSIQDIYGKIQEIEEQNNTILSHMMEIINLLKSKYN